MEKQNRAKGESIYAEVKETQTVHTRLYWTGIYARASFYTGKLANNYLIPQMTHHAPLLASRVSQTSFMFSMVQFLSGPADSSIGLCFGYSLKIINKNDLMLKV